MLLVRVLTLRFDPVLDGFEDAPLRDFLKDKAILSIREHFFCQARNALSRSRGDLRSPAASHSASCRSVPDTSGGCVARPGDSRGLTALQCRARLARRAQQARWRAALRDLYQSPVHLEPELLALQDSLLGI